MFLVTQTGSQPQQSPADVYSPTQKQAKIPMYPASYMYFLIVIGKTIPHRAMVTSF